MLQLLFNRIIIILTGIGAGVALVIGISHLAGVKLPCGTGEHFSGCDHVAMDPWSKIGTIPVAFFGVAAYLFIACIAIIREFKGVHNTEKLAFTMWLSFAICTGISVFLLAHAYFEIKANCLWCTASGIIFATGLILQTISGIYQSKQPISSRFPKFVMPLFFVLIFSGFGIYGYSLKLAADKLLAPKEINIPPDVHVVRDWNPVYGDVNAPIQVVVFSDLHCPSCRTYHGLIMQRLNSDLQGKAKLYFRHFPMIALHPNSMKAAFIAEFARTQGKFWEYIHVVFENPSLQSEDDIVGMVQAVGLRTEDAAKVLMQDFVKTPIAEKIQQDIADATRLGVDLTPCWIVTYPDGVTFMGAGSAINELLSEEMIQKHAGVNQ